MTFLCFLAALGLFFAALPLPGVRAAVVENDAFAGEHSQRILMSDTRIACIRQLMTDDPLMAELLIKIREAAEVNLTLPPNTHFETGARDMLGQSRAAASRIVTSAFVYLIDGDERHFEAARRDLLNVCAFLIGIRVIFWTRRRWALAWRSAIRGCGRNCRWRIARSSAQPSSEIF